MPDNPANAAFVYVPDNYDIPKRGVVGRQAATAGFLGGFLNHSGVGEYWCYAHAATDFDHFRRFVAAGKAPSAQLRCLLPLDMPKLAEVGTLYRPGPDIGDYAWLRRHFDQRSFSLCGVTHTVSDHAAMDAIGRLLIAPVQPWDALVCTSRAARAVVDEILGEWAEYLGERFSKPVEPVCQFPIIPLGVDCDAYAPDPAARISLRARMGIAEDDVAILFMGRLNHVDKANPVPMYLAADAASGSTARKLHLIHAGQFPGPDMEQGFKDAAAAFAPEVKHHFVDGGEAEIYQNIWKAADIFISLSDNIQETFGLTPIEAMAAGLPLVVSDWNGYRDTVQNGEQGFTIPSLAPPPGVGREIAYFHASAFAGHNVMTAATSQSTAVDIAATTEAISNLANDSGLRSRMARSSRNRARQLYDWPNVVAAYQELWAELGERRNHTPELSTVPAGRPADPLRRDPFALFRGHPSSLVGPSSILTIRPQGDHRQLRRLLGSAIAVPLPQVLADADDMTAIVESLESGPQPLSELLKVFSSDRHTQIYLSVVWLAKMGMITIEGDGPDGEPEPPEFAGSRSWKTLSK